VTLLQLHDSFCGQADLLAAGTVGLAFKMQFITRATPPASLFASAIIIYVFIIIIVVVVFVISVIAPLYLFYIVSTQSLIHYTLVFFYFFVFVLRQ
jgi:hypothetical protein